MVKLKGVKRELKENQWLVTIILTVLIATAVIMFNIFSPEEIGYLVDVYAAAFIISSIMVIILVKGLWK